MAYEEIHAHEVENFLQQPNTVVIDIRDIHSYNQGHMKDAMHIDGPTMGKLIRMRKSNPVVLVYCYHGNSSRDMADMISRFGFTNVSHVIGGWEAWVNYQASKTVRTRQAEEFQPGMVEAFA